MPLAKGNLVCPICGESTTEPITLSGNATVPCPNCGTYQLSSTADAQLGGTAYNVGDARAKIAYAVRRQPAGFLLTTYFMDDAVQSVTLPGAFEMLDNVIIHMATAHHPGLPFELVDSRIRAMCGAASIPSAAWVLDELVHAGYVRAQVWPGPPLTLLAAVLTRAGWSRYEELMRHGAGSRHAFMAMKFGDTDLNAFFNDHLKIAVEHAGFILRKLDDSPRAGLIDNRMRVEIRTSRFLNCDLSHGNRGAYWEAGFAEGIGRPVIYMCREDVFTNDHPDKPHFDTNHQTIIKWNPADPSVAQQQLTDMIRTTLPQEARMEN